MLCYHGNHLNCKRRSHMFQFSSVSAMFLYYEKQTNLTHLVCLQFIYGIDIDSLETTLYRNQRTPRHKGLKQFQPRSIAPIHGRDIGPWPSPEHKRTLTHRCVLSPQQTLYLFQKLRIAGR